MTEPLVDVIIPVHSAERPVERAVASVLDHTKSPVRVTVVAHNIDQAIIEGRLGQLVSDPRLRVRALQDSIYSPTGPMNLGLAEAEAPYTALLGSDDEFAPGAIDSWLAHALGTGADAVLARIRLANGRTDPFPPVRGGRRTKGLKGQADRLAYRSAPLGLISRESFGSLRLTEGVKSGEDLAYSLTVWFTGRELTYDLDGPAYVINDDAADRVTSAARPLAEDFAFLDHIESMQWLKEASLPTKQSIAVKLIRIHMFDALRARLETTNSFSENTLEFVSLFDRLEALAPGALALLSRADRRLIHALHDGETDPARLDALLKARQNYLSFSAIVPKNPLLVFHQQAPLRTFLAGLLIMRRA